jgi:hypothetical protein
METTATILWFEGCAALYWYVDVRDRKFFSPHHGLSPEKAFRHRRPFSTPLMAVEPIVDHRMSQRFRLFAVASYDFPGAFNITGMNGYAPLIAFDPGADGVPYASVFHQGIVRSN